MLCLWLHGGGNGCERLHDGGSCKLKAFVDVTMDGEFAVHGLKVLEGDNGLWVGMPSRYDKKNDTYRDVFHPVSSEAREKLFKVVLDEYRRRSGQG